MHVIATIYEHPSPNVQVTGEWERRGNVGRWSTHYLLPIVEHMVHLCLDYGTAHLEGY